MFSSFKYRLRILAIKYFNKPIVNVVLALTAFITITLVGTVFFSVDFFISKGITGLPEVEGPMTTFSQQIHFQYKVLIAALTTHHGILIEAIKYAIALLIFLLAHEMGHYLACRHYGVPATLPFVIPFPLGFGTLGAVIKIKGIIPNRKVLFDIGIAGPLAGFIAVVPFLILGMKLSFLTAQVPSGETISFGEPLLWKMIQSRIFPELSGNYTLVAHPVCFAAWFGLLATSLNLLPLGQLDGGHIAYAVFGRKALILYRIFYVCLILLCLKWFYWFVWLIIGYFIGLKHPQLLDETDNIGTTRKILAILAVIIFIITFMIKPVQEG